VEQEFRKETMAARVASAYSEALALAASAGAAAAGT
jgi:hypothetical protein